MSFWSKKEWCRLVSVSSVSGHFAISTMWSQFQVILQAIPSTVSWVRKTEIVFVGRSMAGNWIGKEEDSLRGCAAEEEAGERRPCRPVTRDADSQIQWRRRWYTPNWIRIYFRTYKYITSNCAYTRMKAGVYSRAFVRVVCPTAPIKHWLQIPIYRYGFVRAANDL